MTAGNVTVPGDLRNVVRSASEEETVAAGETLGRTLAPGDVVALHGELGAGKTRFVRGVCRALGAAREVSSPTFTLLLEYPAPGVTVYHFDFYRIVSSAELVQIGLADYLGRADGICLIEWPGIAEPFLPAARYDVRIGMGESSDVRLIEITRPRVEAA